MGLARQKRPHGSGFKSQLCQVKNVANWMIAIILFSVSGCQALCKVLHTHHLGALTLPVSDMKIGFSESPTDLPKLRRASGELGCLASEPISYLDFLPLF